MGAAERDAEFSAYVAASRPALWCTALVREERLAGYTRRIIAGHGVRLVEPPTQARHSVAT